MAGIAKVITIIGNSPDGFAEAAQVAVTEASKTLRGITGADVLSMSCEVDGDNQECFHFQSPLRVNDVY